MGKIKIGIGILTAITSIGLVLGLFVFANPSDNGKADYAPGQIVVKFKGDVEPFRVIKVPEGKVAEKIKEYQAKTNVIYAEPDYLIYHLGSNDEYYGNQWALNNTGQEIYNKQVLDCMEEGNIWDYCCVQDGAICFKGSSDADVDWEEAWNGFSTSTWATQVATTTAVVAIVDSGIDLSCSESGTTYPGHPDLRDKVIAGHDYVDGNDIPHDVYGHGTHVAGIAAAETDNGIGITGLTFPANIKILAIRVLDENGMGYTSNVAKGIMEAADYGITQHVKVAINLSLGGRDSTTLKNAVNYAWDKGAFLAAAAGNDGGGRKYYPASYPVVISVAATDYNDNTASFSNFNNEIDVSAPGVNVFSTFPTYPFTIQSKYGRSQNYDVGSGTSMSVPHIVGLAGLLFAQDPGRSNADVKTIIEQTADDKGVLGWDPHYGWGRINVYAALSFAPCSSDADCGSGEICCSGECIIPICTTSGGECNDGENCTTDTCINPGTCEAYCENIWPTCDLSTSDGCCGPECTSDSDKDCLANPCSNCFKGVCDGRCNPAKEDATCPDCL